MNDISPVGEIRDIGRRTLFGRLGAATLSATAIALLAGRDSLAAGKGGKSAAAASDVGILNTALGAEYEAVAAYQVGAESKLLQKPVLDLAAPAPGDELLLQLERLGVRDAAEPVRLERARLRRRRGRPRAWP